MSDVEIRIEGSRYERLEEIAWWNQAHIRGARVLVAGAGALGNEILKNLALLGIGGVVVVDFDTVDLSNLSRSVLFSPGDRGRPKVDAARDALARLNPDVRVLPLHGNLRWDVGLGVYRRMDALLSGVDSMEARFYLNRLAQASGRLWIDGGLQVLAGTMRVFTPGADGPCFECGLSRKDYQHLQFRFSCQMLARSLPSDSVPTTPTISALVGALQVQEFVKALHGLEIASGQGVSYDGSGHGFFRVNYPRRADCPAHETLPAPVELPDAHHGLTAREFLALLRDHFGVESARVELDREVIYRIDYPAAGTHQETITAQHRVRREAVLDPASGQEGTLSTSHRLEEPMFADATLAALGVPPLHVLKVRLPDRVVYCELTGDLRRAPYADFFDA